MKLVLLCFLLTSCVMTRAPDEFGRVPVEVRVVDRIWPARTTDGTTVAGRVMRPTLIVVLEGHASERLVAHELCHVLQWYRVGPAFPLVYAAQSVLRGYRGMPLEVEARAAEGDPWFLAWARDLLTAL